LIFLSKHTDTRREKLSTYIFLVFIAFQNYFEPSDIVNFFFAFSKVSLNLLSI